MTEKEYIGDGVYVRYDGYQIELSTQRELGWEKIYLEPSALATLNKYVESFKK